MQPKDDHELERMLNDRRSQARPEFVEHLAASVPGRHPSARPRLTLAFALSVALLVSLVAFGGVGAASSALRSSTSAVKSAVGKANESRGGSSSTSAAPAKKQYHPKVDVCYPRFKYVITYVEVEKTKWVWKTETKNGKTVRVHVKVTYLVKQPVKSKTTSYETKTVSDRRVPSLVSKGAVFPVPAGGCSSVSVPD
jgi:hypothetical protein